MSLLAVVVAVLSVLVVVNLFLSFALIGRLRALQEMVSRGGVMKDPNLPQPGDPVRPFQALTEEGVQLSDEALRTGVSLVGFFTSSCKPCATVRQQLLERPPTLPFMAFVEGSPQDPETRELADALRRVAKVAFTTVDGPAHKAFEPPGYPLLVRVEDGKVAAAGNRLSDVLP